MTVSADPDKVQGTLIVRLGGCYFGINAKQPACHVLERQPLEKRVTARPSVQERRSGPNREPGRL